MDTNSAQTVSPTPQTASKMRALSNQLSPNSTKPVFKRRMNPIEEFASQSSNTYGIQNKENLEPSLLTTNCIQKDAVNFGSKRRALSNQLSSNSTKPVLKRRMNPIEKFASQTFNTNGIQNNENLEPSMLTTNFIQKDYVIQRQIHSTTPLRDPNVLQPVDSSGGMSSSKTTPSGKPLSHLDLNSLSRKSLSHLKRTELTPKYSGTTHSGNIKSTPSSITSTSLIVSPFASDIKKGISSLYLLKMQLRHSTLCSMIKLVNVWSAKQ